MKFEKSRQFCVTRHWKDNPNDFQVLEYFYTIKECQQYIKSEKKSHLYKDKISTWE
jgi:hypothetical protein